MTDQPQYKVGERVSAFHPRMLGVVKVGEIVKIGPSKAHIDFGSINGGLFLVRREHIVGFAD